jgi:hypothetical protein
MTSLWRIDGPKLEPMLEARLDAERNLEDWIESDPVMLDPELIVIGRQIDTGGLGRIDLLGLKSDGSVQIVELKRDRTPREVISQVLEYASWLAKKNTADIHAIADRYSLSKTLPSLADRFQQAFGKALPEILNATHGMLVVASALDRRSKRIVEYLSEVHGVAINTAFFNVYSDGQHCFLTADWLMDQQEVTERTEVRTKAPWAGDWYANIGDGSARSWEDMRKYGFLAAGGGRFYSGRLDQLSPGDRVYAYQKQTGYVGFGVVEGESTIAKDHSVKGKRLFDLPLVQPNLARRRRRSR